MIHDCGRRRFVASLLATGLCLAATLSAFALKEPLVYKGESVEVSAGNTLQNRYYSRDFATDLAFYLEQAKKDSVGRTPGSMNILQVFIRHFDMSSGKDKPIEATCDIPEQFITEAKEYQKIFSDMVFASSRGGMEVGWREPVVIDKINYAVPFTEGGGWWFRPAYAADALAPVFLDKYQGRAVQPGDADFMFFYLHNAYWKSGGVISPAWGGMAWGDEEIRGSRLCTLNDHELSRGIHEWGHHIFDTTLQETEGLTIMRLHGLVDAGYGVSDLGWGGGIGSIQQGGMLAYYRDCNRYFYTRDMWERWHLKGFHNKPRIQASGRAYLWSDVKNDYWVKLPWLHLGILPQIVGLPTLRIDSPESVVTFTLKDADKAKITSPWLAGDARGDSRLNNSVSLYNESAAVLKTANGTWLFVKPQVADLYADMLRMRGTSDQEVPVYGYILEGEKTLIAFRLPANMTLPKDELGFFRGNLGTDLSLKALVEEKGIVAPGDSRFRKSMTLMLKPASRKTNILYTLDGSDPCPTNGTAFTAPITLDATTTVRARILGAKGEEVGCEFMKTYCLDPVEVKAKGLANETDRKARADVFFDSVTLAMRSDLPGQIRYTLDNKAVSVSNSTVYSSPIRLESTTSVRARLFDDKGVARGEEFRYRYVFEPIEVAAKGLASESEPDAAAGIFRDTLTLTMRPHADGQVRYTLTPGNGYSEASGKEVTASNSIVYKEPLLITESTTVKARYFDAKGVPYPREFEAAYTFLPITLQLKNNGEEPPTQSTEPTCRIFNKSMTITMNKPVGGAKIRYGLDGNVDTNSPVYTEPIVLTRPAYFAAQYYDKDGKPRGQAIGACYYTYEKTLTTGKPVKASSMGGTCGPENAVDGYTYHEQSWMAGDNAWLQVDLEKVYKLNKVSVTTYWPRKYAYTIEVSTDATNWTQVVNFKNPKDELSKPEGEAYEFKPTVGRYLRINNISLIVELKAWAIDWKK